VSKTKTVRSRRPRKPAWPLPVPNKEMHP
jgi:hypothetical protein